MLITVVWYAVSTSEADKAATEASITAKEKALTETGVTEITAKVSCPSDGTTDGKVRYEDDLAATTTYLTPTVYFMPQTDGQERVTAGSLSSSAYSTAVDLKCTTSGTKWKAVAVAGSDSSHSVDDGSVFVAEGAFVNRDLVGKAFGRLQFKIEDKYTGGSKFFNISGCTSTTTEGTWTTFNGTQCVVSNGAGGSTGTSLTLAADDYIDARIFLKTNATKRQFGEDGLRTWMIVNANSDELDEPIAYREGGADFISQFAEMALYDQRKYSGYEYAYDIGSFGGRETYIDYFQQTADGVDASTDPVIDFCSETRYNSAKLKDTLLIGCWSDAATAVQQSTSARHYLKFDIS